MENKKDQSRDSFSMSIGNVQDVRGELNIAGGDIYKGYTVEQVSALLTQITSTLQPKPFDGRCPYKGLEVFEENDADLFFGRERLVEDLLGRVQASRTVFITGPSGSGKSSLVRAGLIYALKQGAIKDLHSERWLYETLRPGREPLKDLALAFSRLKSPDLAHYFRAHTNEMDILNECAESVLSGNKDQRLVLFIDQFEEVFTQINQEEERVAFINMLAQAGTLENGRVMVLFAMRSDFISNCATYPALNELLSQQFRQIGAMQPEELVSAIALPARHVGLPLEDELIARIINDMKGEPGALPLMQFALKDLFDSQQEQGGVITLTLEDYLRHGGIHKALERHADRSFAKLSGNEQELARSIFASLIEIGRGTQDTRRTALFDELVPANTKAEAVEAIVQKLADARLIITDEQAGRDTVTISHEKLIDAWPWLKKLVNENRDVIALQNEIAGDAKEWDDHKRDPSYLYTGARLANAREQLAANKLVLSGTASEFVQTGYARQRRGQLVRLTGVSAFIVLLIIAVIGFSYQANESNKQARLARARELAASAVANLETDPELSILLAMQAVSVTQNVDHSLTGEAVSALHRSLAVSRVEAHLVGHTDRIFSGLFSQDGRRVATASWDGQIKIWDAVSGKELFSLSPASGGRQGLLAFSPDGKTIYTFEAYSRDAPLGSIHAWDMRGKGIKELFALENQSGFLAATADGRTLAAVNEDGRIQLADARTGQSVGFIPGVGDYVDAIFSPDGRTLTVLHGASGVTVVDVPTGSQFEQLPAGRFYGVRLSPDGRLALEYGGRLQTVAVWDTVSGQNLFTLYGHTDRVENAVFSPDGKWIASGSLDGIVKLWDAATGQELLSFAAHQSSVNDLAFSGDSRHLVTVSDDATAKIWDLSPRAEGLVLVEPGSPFSGVSYSPDGTRLATSNFNGLLKIWDAASGKELSAFGGGDKDLAHTISFSPDGKQLVSAYLSGVAKVWDIRTGELVATLAGHTNQVLTAVFDPAGKYIATGSEDGTAKIWDARTGRELHTLTGDDGYVSTLAFSPDGKLLATGSGSPRIWDAASGRLLSTLNGHKEEIYGIAFSHDGQRIATGSRDGTVKLWDVKTGAELLTLFGHTGWVYSVAFSQDDKELASAGQDRTVKLWDVATGQELLTFAGHSDQVYGVAFSPDGKRLASASLDGTVRVSLLSIDELMAVARTRVTRDLTCFERVKYLHEDLKCTTLTATMTPAP